MTTRHYFHSSVTRCSDLWIEPFDTGILDRADWATGDFVAGRVVGERNRVHACETKSGRMTELVRGDLLIGALGRRAATLEGVGDWRAVTDDLRLEALTSAGLLGRATSTSPMLPDLMELDYLGHVMRQGRKLNMMTSSRRRRRGSSRSRSSCSSAPRCRRARRPRARSSSAR
jgi:hypothetical protein